MNEYFVYRVMETDAGVDTLVPVMASYIRATSEEEALLLAKKRLSHLVGVKFSVKKLYTLEHPTV